MEAVQTPVLTFEDTALGSLERLVVLRTVGADETRTYHWYQRTGQFPPRRARVAPPAEQGAADATNRPP